MLIKTFLVQAFYIPSGSMETTLLLNDRVLVNKLVDTADEIERGHVVVFRDPGGWLGPGGEQSQGGIGSDIRSVLVFIGLAPAAGDKDLIKRVVGVGGDHVRCCDSSGRLSVNGVAITEPYVFPGDAPSATPFDVTVPRGHIWVMGDHRGASEDSRAHHQQPGASGFVPVGQVIGRSFMIVWPLDRLQLLHRPETFKQNRLQKAS